MIQEATGRTVSGVPIKLAETSFDDVYGRMGLFKIGAGYRTSPRSATSTVESSRWSLPILIGGRIRF